MATERRDDFASRWGRNLRDIISSPADEGERARLAPTMERPTPGTTPYERFVTSFRGDEAPQAEQPDPGPSWLKSLSAENYRSVLAPGEGVRKPATTPDFSGITGTAPQGRFQAQPSEAETALSATDPMRLFERSPEATRKALLESNRQTYRAAKDPTTGTWNVNNTGGPGAVVLDQDDNAQGPDIGRAGRGGFVNSDQSAEARTQYENNLYGGTPESRADLEKNRADAEMARMLQRNPMAIEAFKAAMQERQQQSAIDRTYGQERAKSAAKLESLRQLDDDERVLMDLLNSAATPEQKAAELQRIQEWRARQEVALGLRDRLDAGV